MALTGWVLWPDWPLWLVCDVICLLLPPFAMDFEEDDDIRGWLPGLGDMVRAGTVGGGPGSAAGDLR